MKKLFVVFVVLSALLTGGTGSWGQVTSERGKQWIRSHAFTNSALVADAIDMPLWDINYYTVCNFNASFPWNFDGSHPWNGGSGWTTAEAQFIADMDSRGMPWHMRLNCSTLPANPENTLTDPDADNGWYIADEPPQEDLPGIGQIATWLKANRPNSLVSLGICCRTDSYVDNVISTVDPDVLTMHQYLFVDSGEYPGFFSYMMTMRSKLHACDLLWFTFVQAFDAASDPYWRAPSESEMRMHLFSNLTMGAKGIIYFLYDDPYGPTWFDQAIMDESGAPTNLWWYARDVNSEVNYLGRVLRYLESTGVRFIPGPGHPPPSGLSNWIPGAGGDTHITAISVGETGDKKDGLIGFFTDDTGQRYFMLTNLYRGPSLSQYDASLGFTVTFDAGIDGLWRINRETGAQQWVALTDHVLTTTLQGGSGDLYTYDGSGFDLSAPEGNISINSGAASTTSTSVTLTLLATDNRPGDSGVTHMRFSNDNLVWSDWEAYGTSKVWTLTPGAGDKTVYAKFKDAVGTISAASDSIELVDRPTVGIINRAVLDDMTTSVADDYTWVLWGMVSNRTASTFDIDDGSGVIIHVSGTNTVSDGDYVSVKGTLDIGTSTLTSQEIVVYSP